MLPCLIPLATEAADDRNVRRHGNRPAGANVDSANASCSGFSTRNSFLGVGTKFGTVKLGIMHLRVRYILHRTF